MVAFAMVWACGVLVYVLGPVLLCEWYLRRGKDDMDT